VFDYGNMRIFALDSEKDAGEGSVQLAWLNAQLEDTVKHHPEFVWLLTTWHRPTYTQGGGGAGLTSIDEAPYDENDNWVAAEKSYHITRVLIDDTTARFTVIRSEGGTVIEEFELPAQDRRSLR